MTFSKSKTVIAGLILAAFVAPFTANAACNPLALPVTGTLPGLTAVQDMNAAMASLAGACASSSAPTAGSTGLGSIAGILWHDTATNTLKVRDQADTAWILLGTFDETGKTFTPHVNTAANFAADTGTANAYAAALTPAPAALAAGQWALVAIAHTNTGASTLNLNATGTHAVKINGADPIAGDLLAGNLALFVYDGTYWTTATGHPNPATAYAADTGSANAYAVAPAPAWNAYPTGAAFTFKTANASTGASTLNVSGLGTKSITRRDGSAIQAGDIAAGVNVVVYDGTAWRLATPIAPISTAVVRGTIAGLAASAAGGTTTASVSADRVALTDTSDNGWLAKAVSATLDLSTSGAGGLDTGSVANNTWYALWIINDGGTAKAMASLSATAPTMPGGDVFKARVGWVRTDGAGHIMAFVQSGRHVQYRNTGSGLPQMASGSAGNYSTGVYVAVPLGAYVPSTAASIRFVAFSSNSATGVAPNANYGAYSSTTNPPPVMIVVGSQPAAIQGELVLESTNLYWFSSTSAGALYALAWEDSF